jgi:diaminopimelate decarboxylase
MLDLVESIESAGIPIEHIDFGGGLGINYNGDRPPEADTLWPKLLAKLDARGFGQRRLLIEPGRSLVGNAGVCVTEVLYLKPGDQKNFCVVDAAMNDLPRPAMYQAYHGIVPLRPRSDTASSVWEVVGPVCESGDWIGHERSLSLRSGDLLAVLSAGAYCMSMASNYNSRGRAAEVLVSGTAARLIRRRETIHDQLAAEQGAGFA